MYRLFRASLFKAFMIKEKERRIYQSCEWVVFKKGFLTQCGNNGSYERNGLQPAQSILKAPLTAPKADNKASPCWPMRQSVQQEDRQTKGHMLKRRTDLSSITTRSLWHHNQLIKTASITSCLNWNKSRTIVFDLPFSTFYIFFPSLQSPDSSHRTKIQ